MLGLHEAGWVEEERGECVEQLRWVVPLAEVNPVNCWEALHLQELLQTSGAVWLLSAAQTWSELVLLSLQCLPV